jgi:hypothetical protein
MDPVLAMTNEFTVSDSLARALQVYKQDNRTVLMSSGFMEDRTVAFLVTVVGGVIQATISIFMIIANVTPTKYIILANYAWGQWGISLRVMGSTGLLLSLLVFAGAVMILRNRRVVLGSAIVIACSLLSLPLR